MKIIIFIGGMMLGSMLTLFLYSCILLSRESNINKED